MLLIFFVLAIILGLGLLFVGYRVESFPMAYMSMAIFLFIGLLLFQNGIEIQSGGTYDLSSGDTITVTYDYYTYTPSNNAIVSIFGNILIYGAFVGILLTTFVAVQTRDDW